MSEAEKLVERLYRKAEALRWQTVPHGVNIPTATEDTADMLTAAATLIASQAAEIERLEAQQAADLIKVAVCEAMLSINADDPDHPLIPPTAIDWIGNRLVDAVLAAPTEDPT